MRRALAYAVSLAAVRSDPLVALARPFAVSGGAVTVRACVLALAGCKLRLAKSIEEIGGSIMYRRRRVVDRCGV